MEACLRNLKTLSVDPAIASFVANGEFVLDFYPEKMELPCHGWLESDNTGPQIRTSPCRTHTLRFLLDKSKNAQKFGFPSD